MLYYIYTGVMVDSQKRIAMAFLVGAVLVAGAFYISRNTNAKNIGTGAVSTIATERKHIPVFDADNDNVPDWQDALLDKQDIILPTASTTYEKPTTVTGKFAVNFFKDYLLSKTYGAFGSTPEKLSSLAVQKLSKQAIDELFAKEDISIFPLNDEATLRAYGNHVATILLAHPNTGDNEAIILQDYMNYREPERLSDLDPIALAYTTMVSDMLEAPVPEAYVVQHLNLTNALNAVREDIRGMQKVDEDALYTLMRMKRYQDDVLGLSNALKDLFNTLYLQGNIKWKEGDMATKLMKYTE